MDVFVMGIAGGSGSGKSTFAQKILERFPSQVTIIKCDNYYYSHDDIEMELRDKLNYDTPSAIDFDLLTKHIYELKMGNSIVAPIYDFTQHTRSDKTEVIIPTPIIIIDGILILYYEALQELFDLKIFVETDADERILRRMRRDILERARTIDNVIEQYLSTVKPMHNLYVEPTRQTADVVINGGMNAIALDLVCAKLKEFLSK